MKRRNCVHMTMAATVSATIVVTILAASALLCGSGCDSKKQAESTKTEDYGWFSYAPLEGWKRLDMSRDATSIAFIPDHAVQETGVSMINIRQVDRPRIKEGELAAACIRDLTQQWEYQCSQAKRDGKSLPPFEYEEIPGVIDAPGQVDAFSIQLVRNGRHLRFLTHYIEMSDGRRFIVEYNGSDPGYSEYVAAVTRSLETIRFADAE